MRSKPRVDPEQMSLWDESADDTKRRRRGRLRVEGQWHAHEVTGGEFLSRGWGPGTLLYYAPARRAERGAIALVQVGEQTLVGEIVVELGRPALRTDHGAVWLGPHTQVVGVVRMVEPPLLLPSAAQAGVVGWDPGQRQRASHS